MPNVHVIRPMPVTEVFRITQRTLGVTTTPSGDLHAWNIQHSFAPIWRYTVPENATITFPVGERFYIRLYDGAPTPAEWHLEQEIRIVLWNSVQKEMRIVYTGLYGDVRESADVDRMARYDIALPHIIPSSGVVEIQALAGQVPHTITSTAGHFSLDVLLSRKRI